MPNQPGCSMFALDNRPKQRRQRRKMHAPGASSVSKADEQPGPRPRSGISSRRAVDNRYSTSTTSSALGSASSGGGSNSNIGPIRSSRTRRARKQDEGVLGMGIHYDNWVEQLSSDQRSPASTEGTAPKTPESWGSPMSAASLPGRRNAVSEGPFPAASAPHPEAAVHRATGSSSTHTAQSPLQTRTVHGLPHIPYEGSEHQAFVANDYALVNGQQIQYNYDRSLISPPDAPFPIELTTHAFNSLDASIAQPTNLPTTVWESTFSTTDQPPRSLQHRFSQAFSCFPPPVPLGPMATSPFDSLHYCPELEPLISIQENIRVPGAYPESPRTDTSLAQGLPVVCTENWTDMVPNRSSPAAPYNNPSIHFALPYE